MKHLLLFAVLCTLGPQAAQAKDSPQKEDMQQEKTLEKPDPAEDDAAKEAAVPSSKAISSKPYKDNFIGEMKEHVAAYEDTLVQLARDNDLGYVEMRAANPNLDPWIPGKGTTVLLPTMQILPDAPRKGIVINLPEMRLYYYDKETDTPVSFPLGVGREGISTPLGTPHIRDKKEKPTWRPTARMRKEDPDLPAVVKAGPDNPLGTHILYLGWPEYGIHGTNKPFGIGRRSSSGCIRMYPEDILKLWPEVPVNTLVTVVDQPVKAAWIENEFFIEAHTSIGQANTIEENGGTPNYEMSEGDMEQILKAAGKDVHLLDWPKIRNIIRTRSGYPIVVAKRPEQS